MSAADHAALRVRVIELHDAYETAEASAEGLRTQRNAAIRDALAAGVRPIDLARATGLTRTRITQIAQQD